METPSQGFDKILKAQRLFATLVGCNVFVPNYRINVVTGLVAVCIISYYFCAILTVYRMFHEDWMILLGAFCLASSVFQGCIKLVSAIANSRALYETFEHLREIYACYEKRGPKYFRVLQASCHRVSKTLKIVSCLYLISGIGTTGLPILLLFTTGQRHLIMQVHFPYLDVDTDRGYFGTLAVHLVFMYVGAFGLFASDMLTFVCLMQSFMFADIFKLKIEDLNDMLDDPKQRRHTKKITEQLRDIVRWHQTYSEYTRTCNEFFKYVVTVMVATAGISIIFSLFIIMFGDWPGAYPYSLIAIYTLYVYCILGTKIDDCNDVICTEIYNISWFELSVPQQKIVKIMLKESQKPATIRVAGIFSLSVGTALQITKTIYSIFTMLIRLTME